MTEADVSRKLREVLSTFGAVAWKISDRFHASRPDLVVCHLGRFITIETKIYPNKPTALQEHTMTELNNAEAYVVVATYNKESKWLTLLDYGTGHSVAFKDIRGAVQWLLRHRY